MKNSMNFFFRRLAFFMCVIILIFIIGIFMPATPRSKTSLLFSKIDKDSLMRNVNDNRLILLGGSNLSFGINSQLLKDSLKLNPINNGIQASLGLEYMINEALPYIKKGDIIILSSEYNNFYGSFAYGSEPLCHMFFDVNLKNKSEFSRNMSFAQWRQILMYCPKYVSSKFSPFEYFSIKKDPVYSRDSFNKYGDAIGHLNMPQESYLDLESINDDFNFDVFKKLKIFKREVSKRGAHLYVTFPAIEKQSYINNMNQINNVFRELKHNDFSILGTPEEFIVSKELTFNGYCHLNKKGMDKRTELLIKELRKVL